MKIVVTGTSGLIGSEVMSYCDALEWTVHDLNNNMRTDFSGHEETPGGTSCRSGPSAATPVTTNSTSAIAGLLSFIEDSDQTRSCMPRPGRVTTWPLTAFRCRLGEENK